MDAFRLLYLKYYQKVFSTCLLILKNSALAEEATQEAFLKAYTNLHALREPEKFGAWVAAIGSKQAINMYNRNKKSLTIGEEEKILNIKNIWGEQWTIMNLFNNIWKRKLIRRFAGPFIY